MAAPKNSRQTEVERVPPISVVMPVHNALPYLDQAISSVLGQTYRDFEFVILDDASTDGSRERLREWAQRDSRIRLIEVPENLGPAVSSERVAREARGAIVARTDADDINHPTRLEEQLQVLNDHPDVGVVGGLFEITDADGKQLRGAEPWRLMRRSIFPPFGNGPMMYRRAVFEQVGGYRRECEFWEDLDLILRMVAVTKIGVIPHAIYQVRQSNVSTRFVSRQERLEQAVDLAYRSCRRVEQNESYDDLLSAPKAEKLDPRVFISLGSVVLWAGGRPQLFRRLLRRGKLGLNPQTVLALIWTAWASLHPSSLRRFLLLMVRLRNRFAQARIVNDEPLLWHPLEGVSILRRESGPPSADREMATAPNGPARETIL